MIITYIYLLAYTLLKYNMSFIQNFSLYVYPIKLLKNFIHWIHNINIYNEKEMHYNINILLYTNGKSEIDENFGISS